MTSRHSGMCDLSQIPEPHFRNYGYIDGKPGKFYNPTQVIVDNQNTSQLLVTDYKNSAIRTVGIESQIVGTFIHSVNYLNYVEYLTQHPEKGDLYVTTRAYGVYKIYYNQDGPTVSLIAGQSDQRGFSDGSFGNSLFNYPRDLGFIGPEVILLVDSQNTKALRVMDLELNKVSTLKKLDNSIYQSFLLTNSTLYISSYEGIYPLRLPDIDINKDINSSAITLFTFSHCLHIAYLLLITLLVQ